MIVGRILSEDFVGETRPDAKTGVWSAVLRARPLHRHFGEDGANDTLRESNLGRTGGTTDSRSPPSHHLRDRLTLSVVDLGPHGDHCTDVIGQRWSLRRIRRGGTSGLRPRSVEQGSTCISAPPETVKEMVGQTGDVTGHGRRRRSTRLDTLRFHASVRFGLYPLEQTKCFIVPA